MGPNVKTGELFMFDNSPEDGGFVPPSLPDEVHRLDRAVNLLRARGWVRGTWVRNTSMCGGQALLFAYELYEVAEKYPTVRSLPVHDVIMAVVRMKTRKQWNDIVGYNDDSETTEEDVLAVFALARRWYTGAMSAGMRKRIRRQLAQKPRQLSFLSAV